MAQLAREVRARGCSGRRVWRNEAKEVSPERSASDGGQVVKQVGQRDAGQTGFSGRCDHEIRQEVSHIICGGAAKTVGPRDSPKRGLCGT